MRARVIKLRKYVGASGLGPFLIRSTAGSGAVQISGMLLTFLVGVQLARGLGVEGYGIYGIAMAIISLASVPGEYGLPRLVTRDVAAAAAGDERTKMFSVLRWADRAGLQIGLATALVLALLALALGGRSSPAATAILWGAPIVPLVALARIRGAALQGLHHIVRGQIPFLLFRPLAFAILLFAMFSLLPGAGAPQAMALNAVTAAFAVVLGHHWLKSRLPARTAEPGLPATGRLKSALSMALADGLRLGHFQLAALLLGVLGSASAVGLFRLATSTIVVVALPITLVSMVAAPVVARLFAEGDNRRLQQLCTRSAQMMTVSVVMLTIPLVLWGEQLISFVFGADYAPAAPALLILAAGQVVTAAFGLNAGLLTMTGHEHRVTRAMLWGLLVGVALTVTLVPVWAEVGGSAATVGSLLVWNVLTWLDARRLVGIQTSIFATGAPAQPGPGVERR